MASNNNYLANTKFANDNTLNALYDIAGQAGIKNYQDMSTTDLTTAIKQATGTSGNIYGGTIGNKTLNQYGYKVDKNGNITKVTNAQPGAIANATVNAGGMNIPGTSFYVPATAEGVDAHKLGTFNYQNYLQGIDTLNQGYDGYITQLESGAGNAKAALDEARANALAGIKSTYDDSARNYYRLYRTQEKELPEQLSSIGATGGATESAALRLMNNYSDNLYKNETARNQDINGLNQDYNDAIAKNSMQIAQQIADAYLQKAQALQGMQADFTNSQQNIYNQYLQGLADQSSAQSAASLVAANNAARQQQYDLERQGYSTKGWTDGNGVYQYSITGNPKTTTKSGSGSSSKSGSSGSSGKSGSGSGSGGGYTPTAAYNAAYRSAYAHLNSTREADGRTYGAEAVVNYINNNKNLTTTEKKLLAKDLGLL